MDIAITLDQSLWDKIVSGEKGIELRKDIPSFFNKNKDKVFVIIKGTDKVVGYFFVDFFFATTPSVLLTSPKWMRLISVPQDWISKYVEKASHVYLWYISNVFALRQTIPRIEMGLKSNPQKYAYLFRGCKKVK